MSIYLINGQYVFNEGKKELKTLNNGTNIRLTTMRARCLSFIIEHANDEVIEKSAISYALWGARSTFTSDASLTQTLYLIRRDLKTLGLDELFITVPKSGIRVNSSITIDVIHEKMPKTKSFYKPLFFGLILLLLLIGIGVQLALTI
ncbi:winged helix-turn-helix domain-containing protein [Rahnella sp. PCH160]|uniref:winged helix-turn-helix domain-containing protein n=1 Tax=Rahnella sp. PCH160 TaxID=3447928 RepID=UPI0039FBD2AF